MKTQDVFNGVAREEKEGGESPARVVQVLDPFNLVIDRGRNMGVERGEVFEVYRPQESAVLAGEAPQVFIRGLAEVVAVYKKTAALRSITPAFIIERPSAIPGYLGGPQIEVVSGDSGRIAPFEDPQVGDLARPAHGAD
ncbi:hypothetical protein LLH00_12290 [bacterium]|nr:hypothetical protein [bacterium]